MAKIVTVAVADTLSITPGEQRWLDVIAARGDTPRLVAGSPSLSQMADGAALIIITDTSALTTTATLIDAEVPVICSKMHHYGQLKMSSGSASPPNMDRYQVAAGAVGSPFVAGRSGEITVWSREVAQRHVTTVAGQMIFHYPGNTGRIYGMFIDAGGTLVDGVTVTPAARYGITLVEDGLANAFTANTQALMEAAYDQMIGEDPGAGDPVVTVTVGPDQSVAGGATITGAGTPLSGAEPFTWDWATIGGPTLGLIAGDEEATVTAVVPLVGGTSELEATARDANDNTGTDSLLVTASPRTRIALKPAALATGWSVSDGGTDAATPINELYDQSGIALLSPEGTGGAPQTIGLGALPTTVRTEGFHVYPEISLTGAASSAEFVVELLEGATVRASQTLVPTTGRTRPDVFFDAADCAPIVDLTACSLRLTSSVSA